MAIIIVLHFKDVYSTYGEQLYGDSCNLRKNLTFSHADIRDFMAKAWYTKMYII